MKQVCLISRSVYPKSLAMHKQNMQTFNGWLTFWDRVLVISQTNTKVRIFSKYGKILGVLLPYRKNKYLNFILFTFQGFLEIKKLNSKRQISIFQASDAGGAFLALFASKIFKKKFIFEIQGDIFDYPSIVGGIVHSSLVKLFSKILAKQADYIRIVSPFLYDPLEKLGINNEKIYLVPPRCDSKNFNPDYQRQENLFFPSAYGLNIIFIGNLLLAKGVDILLEAFNLILKDNFNIGLVYVGEGEEKTSLIARSKKLGISENVFFLGKVSYDSIPFYLDYADLLVLPSREEGVGRVILEAMAMKTPVIASNVGGIPLLISDNRDGLLFSNENVKELADKINRVFNEPELKSSIVENAYKKFIESYEYEVSMQQFIEMYRDICVKNNI